MVASDTDPPESPGRAAASASTNASAPALIAGNVLRWSVPESMPTKLLLPLKLDAKSIDWHPNRATVSAFTKVGGKETGASCVLPLITEMLELRPADAPSLNLSYAQDLT